MEQSEGGTPCSLLRHFLRQPQRAYYSWRLYNRRVQRPFNTRFISQVYIISDLNTRFIDQMFIISDFNTRFIDQMMFIISDFFITRI